MNFIVGNSGVCNCRFAKHQRKLSLMAVSASLPCHGENLELSRRLTGIRVEGEDSLRPNGTKKAIEIPGSGRLARAGSRSALRPLAWRYRRAGTNSPRHTFECRVNVGRSHVPVE